MKKFYVSAIDGSKKSPSASIFFSNLFHLYKSGVCGDLANFFDPSVKLPLALSKGLCHKQPIETKQTKETTIMNYTIALSIAAKATAYLQDNEGNMSESEVVVHISALHLALKSIADHNSVELPPLT